MDRISSLVRFINAQGNPETAKNTPTRYVVPLRFQGTVVNVENNLCHVRWNDDPRDFDEFRRKVHDYLSDWDRREDGAVDYEYLEVGKFYLVQSEKHVGRCKVFKRADSRGFTTFYMIDEGVLVSNSRGTFYNLPPEFSKGSLAFPFVASLAPADEFQLFQLNLKSGFDYLSDVYENDVFDIFVLSGEEPYCAVIGSDATLKAVSGIGLDVSSASYWENLMTNSALSPEVVPVHEILEPRYLHGLRTVTHVVAGFETPEKVYLRDVVSSLRLIYLTEKLRDYRKTPLRMANFADFGEIYPGSVVIVLDKCTEEFIRAKVTFFSEKGIDVVGIDFPDRKLSNLKLEEIFMMSTSVSNVPVCVKSFELPSPSKKENFIFCNFLMSFLMKVGAVVNVQYTEKNYLRPNIKVAVQEDIVDLVDYVNFEIYPERKNKNSLENDEIQENTLVDIGDLPYEVQNTVIPHEEVPEKVDFQDSTSEFEKGIPPFEKNPENEERSETLESTTNPDSNEIPEVVDSEKPEPFNGESNTEILDEEKVENEKENEVNPEIVGEKAEEYVNVVREIILEEDKKDEESSDVTGELSESIKFSNSTVSENEKEEGECDSLDENETEKCEASEKINDPKEPEEVKANNLEEFEDSNDENNPKGFKDSNDENNPKKCKELDTKNNPKEFKDSNDENFPPVLKTLFEADRQARMVNVN